MKNTFKNLFGAVALTAATYSPMQAQTSDTTKTVKDSTQKELHTTVGFNALETAMTNDGDARIRAYAEFGLSYKTFDVGYSGMNQFTGNLETYFGRHDVLLGLHDKKLKLIGVVKTTANGVIDAKYGLRYVISDKLGVDYGRVDISANKDGGDATFFLGKSLGKKVNGSVELFESVGIDFQGKIAPYTELQINKEVMGGLNVFLRGEMVGVGYKDNVYLLGVSKMF